MREIFLAVLLMMAGLYGHLVEKDSPLWDCHTMGNQTCGTAETNLGGAA